MDRGREEDGDTDSDDGGGGSSDIGTMASDMEVENQDLGTPSEGGGGGEDFDCFDNTDDLEDTSSQQQQDDKDGSSDRSLDVEADQIGEDDYEEEEAIYEIGEDSEDSDDEWAVEQVDQRGDMEEGKDAEDEDKEKSIKKRFLCSLCRMERSCHSPLTVQGHLRVCHEMMCRNMLDVKPGDTVKCHFCDKGGIASVDYALHVDKHMYEWRRIPRNLATYKHLCSVCNMIFKNDKRITLHAPLHMTPAEFHQVKNPYQCKNCGIMCSTVSATTRHEKTCVKGLSLDCKVCQYKAPFFSHWLRHMESHRNHKSYSCPVCNQDYQCYGHYIKHMNQVHKEEWEARKSTDGLTGKSLKRKQEEIFNDGWKRFCYNTRTVNVAKDPDPARFKEEYSRNAHTQDTLQLTCALCKTETGRGKDGSTYKLLPFHHVLECHKKLCFGEIQGVSTETMVQCSICFQEMEARKYAAHIHLELGKPEDRFECKRPGCKAKLSCETYQKEHFSTHWTRENFERFDNKDSTNTNTESFSQQVQAQKPSTSQSAQDQESIRDDRDRSAGKVCRFCDQVFQQRSHLENHEKKATDEIEKNGLDLKETPYSCNIDGCVKSFPTQLCMSYHIKIKHKKNCRLEKKICPICKKIVSTNHREVTFKHLLECHNELLRNKFPREPTQPYKCPLCDKSMTYKDAAAHFHMELGRLAHPRCNFDTECSVAECKAKLYQKEVELHRRLHMDTVVEVEEESQEDESELRFKGNALEEEEESQKEEKKRRIKLLERDCTYGNHKILGPANIFEFQFNRHITKCQQEIEKFDLNIDETPYSCVIETCSERFPTRACLRTHYRNSCGKNANREIKICPLCKVEVGGRNDAFMHVIECHEKLLQGVLNRDQSATFTCWDKGCNETVSYINSAAHFHGHMKGKGPKNGKPGYKCMEINCTVAYAIAGHLELHKRTHATTLEGYQETATDVTMDERCPHCKQSFRRSEDLIQHLENISEEEEKCTCSKREEFELLEKTLYKCGSCSHSGFKYRACEASHAHREHYFGILLTLNDHHILHDLHCARSRRCPKCTCPFQSKKVLQKHIASGKCKPRRHKCKFCYLRFATANERGYHERNVHKPSAQSYETAYIDVNQKAYYPRAQASKRRYIESITKIPKQPYSKAEEDYFFNCTHCEKRFDVWGKLIRHLEQDHHVHIPLIVKGRLTTPRYNSLVPVHTTFGIRRENACYICQKRFFCETMCRIHQDHCQPKNGIFRLTWPSTNSAEKQVSDDKKDETELVRTAITAATTADDDGKKTEKPKGNLEPPPPKKKKTVAMRVQEPRKEKELSDFLKMVKKDEQKEKYPCNACSLVFKTRTEVMDHLEKVHSLDYGDIRLDEAEGEVAYLTLPDGTTPDNICHVCCKRFYCPSFIHLHFRGCISRRQRDLRRQQEKDVEVAEVKDKELQEIKIKDEELHEAKQDVEEEKRADDEVLVIQDLTRFEAMEMDSSDPYASMELVENLGEAFEAEDVKTTINEMDQK